MLPKIDPGHALKKAGKLRLIWCIGQEPGYYPAEEKEAHEQELKEDYSGLPPKEYLADWEQIDRPVRPAFSFRKWLKKIWPGKLDRTR